MKKSTQAEARRRDNEIDADEKELKDLRDTPPSMLDDLERLKVMGGKTKPAPSTPKSFEERMRDATPAERKRMMAKGGMVKSSASKRADGCAQRGKTKGKMV